jgi:uncharacterized protein
MAEIRSFPFQRDKFEELRSFHYGTNWPVVYIQENGKEAYIGQTTSLYSRSKQHYENSDRVRLKKIHIITDEEFNLSSAYDFESLLIQYVAADGILKLQNNNGGLVNHNYYDRERYLAKLEVLWPKLKELGLVKNRLVDIRNSEFFKYSPYKALTEDQLTITEALEKDITTRKNGTYIVNGAPGTGKSILALYLLKRLKERKDTKDLKVALVVPMTGLRTTLQRVVKRVPGLGAEMVIGPSDVAKKQYNVLLVDEAHRLLRRVNITNFKSYDDTNRKLGLPKDATQLDWITTQSAKQILFYDAKQTVRPSDVRSEDIRKLKAQHYELNSQMRVEGGEDYLKFIEELLDLKVNSTFTSETYEFKVFEDIGEMISVIKKKNIEHSLARIVAGYAWSWATKGGKEGHDIEIEGHKLVWNSTNIDWVNSPNAINEVGCIHTVQGYDLNYAGVIIGPEISYDEETDSLIVDEKEYKDINGKRSISHPDELKEYILNIYKTLLTRGIKGTYVYVVDEKLRRRMMGYKPFNVRDLQNDTISKFISPIQKKIGMVRIPILGSAPCGDPFFGDENKDGEVSVSKNKIKPGYKYFILRAEGDSMNLAGINDGDLVLCRQQQKADTGDRVVALLAGENVTIKEYGPRENGIRLLLPKSSNKIHQPIVPQEGDTVQGIVQEVLED